MREADVSEATVYSPMSLSNMAQRLQQMSDELEARASTEETAVEEHLHLADQLREVADQMDRVVDRHPEVDLDRHIEIDLDHHNWEEDDAV